MVDVHMMQPVKVHASFPAIQSALKRSGDGGGMRIQLDIPESDMAQAVMLLAMTQVVLKVTIEIDTSSPYAGQQPVNSSAVEA
jgi:hypothetical protein